MNEHVFPKNAWPTGHPLPPVIESKLTGPEVGSVHPYEGRYGGPGQTAEVLERSYVWSPGECRHRGGYRRYDWSVVRVVTPERSYTVVVDDKDLSS